ncbi:peptidase [Streptomyces sp. NPDC052042]|uniref:peptidase n=1 Tax=Streptomyces sp. NPDC052042 TaxID=3365683 RepID=UPI0037CE4E1F
MPLPATSASPDLVGPIVEGGADPATDPAWAESGASSRAEYARWAGHLCGVTCLRRALGPGAPSLFELRDGAIEYGAYTQDAEGVIRGLIYAPFAQYAREVHGLDATVHRHLSSREILGLLDGGRTVLASVHHGIRRPDLPPPRKGGHLVLLTARTADGTGVHFHSPSGITAGTRAAELPLPGLPCPRPAGRAAPPTGPLPAAPYRPPGQVVGKTPSAGRAGSSHTRRLSRAAV